MFKISLILLSIVFFLCGCSSDSFISDDATEFEARVLLEEASRLDADSAVKNLLPEIYEQPPRILNTSNGTKVIYFAKNQTPKVLAALLKAQMKSFVSEANATNQIVVNCANEEEAGEVISFLENADVLPIQIKISCLLIEHYADLTMDRETTVHIGELFGTDLTLGAKTDSGEFLPTFPGASLREPGRSDLGIEIGYLSDTSNSDAVKVVVDMLESRGYLKVMMNPELEVLSGQKATFTSREQVPTIKTYTDKNNNSYSLTEYVWIEDYLEVVPCLYADGSIGVKTKVTMSSKSTPEGVVQQRIISKKTIDIGENRIKPGVSLIIGGFKKAENVSIVRGFPYLKDIPLIGFLFSSKDFEERAKETTFIITPSISTYGKPYDKMLAKARAMNGDHVTDSEVMQIVDKMMIDPFDKQEYKKKALTQVDDEEMKRVRAEIDLSKREEEKRKLKKEIDNLKARLEFERQSSVDAEKSAQQYQKEIEKVEKLTKELEAAIESKPQDKKEVKK